MQTTHNFPPLFLPLKRRLQAFAWVLIGPLDRTPWLWLDRVTVWLNFLTNDMKTKGNSDLFASDFPLSAGYMDLIDVSLKIIFQSIRQRAGGLG